MTYSTAIHHEDMSEKNLEHYDKQPPSSPPQFQNHNNPPQQDQSEKLESLSQIQELLLHPTLFDPVLAPRYPIVLCHGMAQVLFKPPFLTLIGLYGFDVRGPSSFPVLQMHYWSNVLRVLKKTVGAEVIVTGVPGYFIQIKL